MKLKLILLLIIGCLFIGCSDDGKDLTVINRSTLNTGASVITVNECQYIVYVNNRWAESSCAMVHAGNCSNPIHKQK